jgi:hypothetical protein
MRATYPPQLASSVMLEHEARALLTRLDRVQPFAMQETTVAAAAIPLDTLSTIDRMLITGRSRLRQLVLSFIRWIRSNKAQLAPPHVAQRRFTIVRLRFNAALTQLDIFADALTQRSERDTGVWLSGLDIAARDALKLSGNYYRLPPLMCYLDRGHGAAIRRARTRLPGGDENPVAVIRVPRERMIGSSVASSLFHEVGHQAASLLELVESIRPVLQALQRGGKERDAWKYWDRCISEILADFWSVARLGITSTLGLIGVVSLPRYFVFRLSMDDPHPVPWLRVKLSCAMGRELFPHPQWDRLERLWEQLYPAHGFALEQKLRSLEETMPALASLIANHRPKLLKGNTLRDALETEKRQPSTLAAHFGQWRASPLQMRRAPPSLVFATIGQARANGMISPESESKTLAALLRAWALRDALSEGGHASCGCKPEIKSGVEKLLR